MSCQVYSPLIKFFGRRLSKFNVKNIKFTLHQPIRPAFEQRKTQRSKGKTLPLLPWVQYARQRTIYRQHMRNAPKCNCTKNTCFVSKSQAAFILRILAKAGPERATGGSWHYGQMAWNGVGGARANFASPLRSVCKVDLCHAPCSRRLRALRYVAKNNDTPDAICPPYQLPPVALSSKI